MPRPIVPFFSPEEEARIVEAIRLAELGTTGEIRVHLESEAKQDALQEGIAIFRRLGMEATRHRNGVLILLDITHKSFAILGDVGINKLVGTDFWETERDLMQQYFRQHQFVEGIVLAVQQVGGKLRRHFPAHPDDRDNPDELSNEVSYG